MLHRFPTSSMEDMGISRPYHQSHCLCRVIEGHRPLLQLQTESKLERLTQISKFPTRNVTRERPSLTYVVHIQSDALDQEDIECQDTQPTGFRTKVWTHSCGRMKVFLDQQKRMSKYWIRRSLGNGTGKERMKTSAYCETRSTCSTCSEATGSDVEVETNESKTK